MTNTATFRNSFEINLDRNRDRNIVFYGRVSTEHEAQLDAFENQIQWYDDVATKHQNWTVLEKYLDRGITGTQAKKRPAFLQMLEDARQDKFDLVVTREVCRFARNTVDTLVATRKLKSLGVEVYFVEDNIWTMDGDGELRLTLMATLAQDESRKISERVRAGQKISRDNGVIYGTGNILGYDKVGGTYVINPEQAETVRLIYDLYLNHGLGIIRIANELNRLKKTTATGVVKWSQSNVGRILKNQTYMGYIAYGKSFSNNYLEQKRINNHDSATYMMIKGDFEPIISEEDWRKCKEIRKRRITPVLNMAISNRKSGSVGKADSRDVWMRKLRCDCGASFRKNRWHKNKNKKWSYGYQCYNQINNGSAKKRREAGLDDVGFCDMNMIADWKLEVMSKAIMERLWGDRKESVQLACEMIRDCYKSEQPKTQNNTAIVEAKIAQIKMRLNSLIDMRSGGEITKEQFIERRDKLNAELKAAEAEFEEVNRLPEIPKDIGLRWDAIIETLNQAIDISNPKLSREILEKFVVEVIPQSKSHYVWKINLDNNYKNDYTINVDGRKSGYKIYIPGDTPEGDEPSHLHMKVLYLSDFLKLWGCEKYSLGHTPHRRRLEKASKTVFMREDASASSF